MNDLISRQDFDKFLEDAEKEAVKNRKYVFASALNAIRGNLKNFPSAQPEKHTDKRTETHACDCISRQAAIDALNGEIEITGRTNAEAVKGYVRLVKDRLERLPSAQPERQWIPCSERLPEQYGNYLVSYRTDDFESDIGTFNPDRINSDTGEWSACDANGFYWVASKGLEVIAWMPLPEPYAEGWKE